MLYSITSEPAWYRDRQRWKLIVRAQVCDKASAARFSVILSALCFIANLNWNLQRKFAQTLDYCNISWKTLVVGFPFKYPVKVYYKKPKEIISAPGSSQPTSPISDLLRSYPHLQTKADHVRLPDWASHDISEENLRLNKRFPAPLQAPPSIPSQANWFQLMLQSVHLYTRFSISRLVSWQYRPIESHLERRGENLQSPIHENGEKRNWSGGTGSSN